MGIGTAIDGVGSSPGAEGCMAGGCMGLKAPASVKPDCWLACSSCFWRGIPAPGMYPGWEVK